MGIATLVLQGRKDFMKICLTDDTYEARKQTTIIVVAIEGIFGHRIFSSGVAQAYMESAKNVMWDLFINLAEE